MMLPVQQIILIILISSLHIQNCVQEKLWENIYYMHFLFRVLNVMYVFFLCFNMVII